MFNGIRAKLGAIFAFLSIAGFSLVVFGVTRIHQVTEQADLVIAERIPLSRSAEEALHALTLGAGTIDRVLLIGTHEEIGHLQAVETRFKESVLIFDMFTKAMIWGSKTEAFQKSTGGLVSARWEKMGLQETLVVNTAPYEIQQAAGKATLYFGGFAKYVEKVIASQEKILRLQPSGNKEAIAQEERRRETYITKAKRYKNLVDETLHRVVTDIYAHVGAANDHIRRSRDSAVSALIVYSTFIFGLALTAGIFFVRSIFNPLIHLKIAAAEIAGGKLDTRVEVTSKDEIGSLAETFNKMVIEVQKAYDDLEKKIRERTALLIEEITERKRVEADLRKMAEEVQQARDGLENQVRARTKELESFVYALSHDLKGPVISLQGVASLLLEEFGDRLDEKGKHYIQRVLSNADYLADFIQGMQILTKVGSQQKNEPIDVRAALIAIIDRYKEWFDEKRVQVAVHPSLPHFTFDAFHITQLFQNLIVNAGKFMGDQPRPRIEIGGSESEEWAEFYVKDNGIGIDPAYHKKIFDPFQQLKEVEAGGVGFGLSIITKIVHLAGGKIWVESQKGEGATFFVRLPKDTQVMETIINRA